MFIPQELDQIISHGLTEKQVKKQLQTFKDGAPFTHVTRHAGLIMGLRCMMWLPKNNWLGTMMR